MALWFSCPRDNLPVAVHHKGLLRCTMPTKNPRITITLEPATHARLQRLSELTGQSQSSMVAEILDSSAQVFDRTITVLEAAQTATREMKDRASSDLAAAQSKLEGQLGLALELFEGFTGTLLDDAEAVRRRARRGTKAAPSSPAGGTAKRPTPMSNRGVRSTPRNTKDHKKRG